MLENMKPKVGNSVRASSKTSWEKPELELIEKRTDRYNKDFFDKELFENLTAR